MLKSLKNHAFSVINFFKQDVIKGDYDQSESVSIHHAPSLNSFRNNETEIGKK